MTNFNAGIISLDGSTVFKQGRIIGIIYPEK
jgi:hypothetical protein